MHIQVSNRNCFPSPVTIPSIILTLIMSRSLRLFGSACFISLAAALPAPELIDDESLQCVSVKNAWETASSAWSAVWITQTLSSTQYWPDIDVSYTTLCDGRPRAIETRYPAQYTTLDPPLTTVVPQWLVSDFTPAPTCKIAETACSTLLSSYNAAVSDWRTNDAPSPILKPQCTTYQSCNPDGKNQCQIWGAGGKLYYWPVTTTMGDFCAYNGSTVFAAATNPPSPNTVVTDGYTFTSPTNYASFPFFQAWIPTTSGRRVGCGTQGGHENVVVPLTETFYSNGKGGTSSFNFQDLNTVPVAAYEAQRKCNNGRDCTTIEGDYFPQIPLPTEILNLEPKEWKDAKCYGRPGISGELRMTPVPLITPAPAAPGN
jgi:hypothetical protein